MELIPIVAQYFQKQCSIAESPQKVVAWVFRSYDRKICIKLTLWMCISVAVSVF
jgi:hypothetical protein